MNFFSKIFSWWPKKGIEDGLPLSTGGADPFVIWREDKKISIERAMQVYSGWVYACIRAIAEEIMIMKWRLFQVKKDGTHEEIFDHELLDLLHAVNENQTGTELKYLTATHLELGGNSYWFLDGVKDELSQPTGIYILNPRYMKVLKDKINGHVIGYEYRVGTQSRSFKNYEILHLKYPDPNDPFEGLGTVQAAAQWIDADNYAAEFNRRYFLNGARIGGFLESENALNIQQLDFLRKSFEAVYKGVENAHRVAVLPKGTTFKEGQTNSKDMDFVNLQTMMRDKILAAFRVPRTALGITDDVNRANAEATNYVFALRTIKPKMELIVSFLNEFLVPRFGDNLYLDFADPVPENRELKIQEFQATLGGSPALSVNEAREEYFGLGPVEKGEKVRVSFGLGELGAPLEKSIRLRVKDKDKKKIATRFAKNAQKRKEISISVAKQAADALREVNIKTDEAKKKGLDNLTDDEFEPIWKGFITRIRPYEERQKSVLKDFNAVQKEEVLNNLVLLKAINKDDLFNYKDSVKSLADISGSILIDLFEKEGKAAGKLLGFDLHILTTEVRKALRESIELMSSSYNDETLNLLKSKLEEGLKQGASLNELRDIVSGVYEFSDEVRAERLAQTEVFRIANDATHEAWKQSGIVKSLKWYTASDERVCLFCGPLHGKVIGIDENFYEKGDEVRGANGNVLPVDYEDINNPPLHPNCRCYIRPEDISLD